MRLRAWAFLVPAAVTLVSLAPTGCGVAARSGGARSPGARYSRGATLQGAAMDRDADGIPASVDAAPVHDERVAQNGPGAPPPAAGGSNRPTPPPNAKDAAHDAALLIYTAEIGLAVYQVETSMNEVEKIAREVGGYLSVRGDQRIVVRVPRARFEEAVRRVEHLGDVTHRNITAEDVTDEYVDVEVRLKNAYVLRARLQDLLKGANAVKDALEIEKELGRVTESIERMEGQLKLLRDKIAYSTVTATFSPLAAQSVPDAKLIAPFPWLGSLGLGPLLNVRQ